MTSESENSYKANSSSFVGIMLELVISLVVTNYSQTDKIGTINENSHITYRIRSYSSTLSIIVVSMI